MKALVKNIVKEENPRVDAVSGKSETVPVVVVEVDYLYNDGTLHSSVRQAFLPEELEDLTIFDRQADVMQRDIDDAAQRKQIREVETARNKPTDDKVASLRGHFKLDLKDDVPLGDR